MSEQSGFQQKLGLFDATMLVAGSMIGSGIYLVSAEIVRDTGGSGWLLVVWAVAGLMTVLGALSYAELAAMMPQAGGQYVFLREAFSPMFGFLYGWTLFTVIQTGTIAAVGVAFAKFLGVLVPSLGEGIDRQMVGVILILGLTFWNTLGINQGRWLQNIFTVAKIGSLAALIIIGLFITSNSEISRLNFSKLWGNGDTQRMTEIRELLPQEAGQLVAWMVAGGALVGALFSADAWGNVTFVAGEVRNPRRNIALSMVLGTGLVVGLYLLANVAYLSSLPLHAEGSKHAALANVARDKAKATPEDLQTAVAAGPKERGIEYAREDRVGTALIELGWPADGARLMALAIMVSTFGCLNGLILMGARLYYAMARDGLFFRGAGNLNQHQVPSWGLWAQAIWASILVFSGTYGQLLVYVIFAALLFYGLTVIGLFVLRRKQPQMERPYRVVAYPLVPGLYVALCFIVMIDLLVVKPIYTWPGLIIVLTGVPVYFFWRSLTPKSETRK